MKTVRISCHAEMDLDHRVFGDYEGPMKCFICGCRMDAQIFSGKLHALSLQEGDLSPLDQKIGIFRLSNKV